MSLAGTAWEPAQVVRVTRTFLEVVEICAAPPRSRTMPALPSLSFDLEEEPAPGYAVLAEPNGEEKLQEPDQDQRFVVRVSRTFLEVSLDVTNDDEICSLRLQSRSMSILPSFELDFEKEREEEDSFGAFLGQEATEPIPRGTPIFHPNLAAPAVGIAVPEPEMASVAMATPHRPEPLLPGLVVHPHGSADMGGDVERIGEVKAVGKEDEGEELKPLPQHADTHSGPFPLRMVEQHNNGRCYPSFSSHAEMAAGWVTIACTATSAARMRFAGGGIVLPRR